MRAFQLLNSLQVRSIPHQAGDRRSIVDFYGNEGLKSLRNDCEKYNAKSLSGCYWCGENHYIRNWSQLKPLLGIVSLNSMGEQPKGVLQMPKTSVEWDAMDKESRFDKSKMT